LLLFVTFVTFISFIIHIGGQYKNPNNQSGILWYVLRKVSKSISNKRQIVICKERFLLKSVLYKEQCMQIHRIVSLAVLMEIHIRFFHIFHIPEINAVEVTN